MLKAWHNIFIPSGQAEGQNQPEGLQEHRSASSPSISSGTSSVFHMATNLERVHSHSWRDLGMQLLPCSAVSPAGLGSGLALGSLLSLLEGFSASNSENAGSSSQTSRMMPISSQCRQHHQLSTALLSQILILNPWLSRSKSRGSSDTAARLLTEFTHSPEFLSPFHFHSHQKA